jgi:hypothetical protein
MYEIFKRSFRADHEYMLMPTLSAVIGLATGETTRSRFVEFVVQRDATGDLEVDAAGFHYLYADVLLDLHPRARFILTMRDCYSWLNSCIGLLSDDFYRSEKAEFIGNFINNLNQMPDGSFTWTTRPRCKVCLKQLMKMWSAANASLVRRIPADRLLVLRTGDLTNSIPAIAEFSGVAANDLDVDHANKGPGLNFLSCFDGERLERLVQRYCGHLMAERFPGVTLANAMSSGTPVRGLDRVAVRKAFSLDRFVAAERCETL